jgi:tetratricopeptide (TPR) repeat protein
MAPIPRPRLPWRSWARGAARPHPWLQVLAEGVAYIPLSAKIDTRGWHNETLRKTASSVLDLAFQQNDYALSGPSLPAAEEMDEIVNTNKRGQFLLESIDGSYVFNPLFPEVTCREDPFRAQIFHDLAAFIVKNTLALIREDFNGFSASDLRLLHSAQNYLLEAIVINESAAALSPERFRNKLVGNIATGYNNLGLVLSFLGDTKRAYQMYTRALDLKPDHEEIVQNLEAIDRNAAYIRQGHRGATPDNPTRQWQRQKARSGLLSSAL